MKSISRLVLIGLLALIVLTSACNLPVQGPPTPVGTILSTAEITGKRSPTNTPSSVTPTPFIPITGMDVVSLQCQFCVNEEAHAVLIMSDQTFFNVADPDTGVTCLSAQELNGRRILLCRGAQQASFNLDICLDSANCLQFPITLQTCPLVPATGVGTVPVLPTFAPFTPVILTPRNRLDPPAGVTSTIVPSTLAPTNAGVTPTVAPLTPLPTNTDVIPPLPTSVTVPPPLPTSTAQPSTVEPPPEPTATNSETGGGGGDDSVVICHVAPGNPDARTTLRVSQSAWENEHSAHGDSRGAC